MINGKEIYCCGVELMEFCNSLSKKEYSCSADEKLDYLELIKEWMMKEVYYLLTYITEDGSVKKICGHGIKMLIRAMLCHECSDFIIEHVIQSIFKEYIEVAHDILNDNIDCLYVWDRSRYYNLVISSNGDVENIDLPFKYDYEDEED